MLRSVKYGLYGAVLAGLVGGSIAWSNVDKTVTLVVDGQATHVHTTASRVADVLKAEGYQAGPHDLVAPAANASIHGGSTIIYDRGRELRLTVDGASRDIWTTAPTVSEALAQLGYSSADFTSVSRAQRLPLNPTDITVRTPMLVTVVDHGQTQQLTTTDLYVSDLLDDLGITLVPGDRLSAPANTALWAGEKLTIEQVLRRTVTTMVPVPFQTTHTVDPLLPTGQTQIASAGHNGGAQITYAVVYVDGRLAGRTPMKTVTVTPPTNQVVQVGSQVATPAATTPAASAPAVVVVTPGSAQAIAQQMLAARGWGNDQFSCLVTMWGHESGWRVDAANPSGAYGIPQALPGSKMAAYGPNWQTSASTQIAWGLAYITSRYGTPCGAWAQWQANGGWY